MSQVIVSQQDIQAIQLLTSQVLPKLINRVKAVEDTCRIMQENVTQLQEQVRLLHEAAAAEKTEPAVRKRRKKKTIEVPQLIEPEPEESGAASPLAGTGVAAGVDNAPGIPAVGIVAATQNAEAEVTGDLCSKVSDNVVIGGIPIASAVVNAVHYCLAQGASDPAQIAQVLQCPEEVITYVLALIKDN